ncbi:MAG: flagellar export protein FliJ [Bdellovibrionaceae bacterium]|nr:flagellar export protein FliJ [Pseudobdellovibrionaceae bacterium]
MKFKFVFERVLQHRKSLENIAQKEFQESLSELSRQQGILRDMEQSLSLAHKSIGQRLGQGGFGTLASVYLMDDFIKGQEVLIERQKQLLVEKEKEVEARREILRQRTIETKIIERLKERKKREFVAESERRDQAQLDELGVLRHSRRIVK